MDPLTPSTKSSLPAGNPADDKAIKLIHDLDLPEVPGFKSKPYNIGFDAIFQLSEDRLPWVTRVPGFQERRNRRKADVPFEL
jgi:hypothetical protein